MFLVREDSDAGCLPLCPGPGVLVEPVSRRPGSSDRRGPLGCRPDAPTSFVHVPKGLGACLVSCFTPLVPDPTCLVPAHPPPRVAVPWVTVRLPSTSPDPTSSGPHPHPRPPPRVPALVIECDPLPPSANTASPLPHGLSHREVGVQVSKYRSSELKEGAGRRGPQ